MLTENVSRLCILHKPFHINADLYLYLFDPTITHLCMLSERDAFSSINIYLEMIGSTFSKADSSQVVV